MYRPICVEITGCTGKHFCTTYELWEYKEALLYYVAIVCVEIAGRTRKYLCTTHELREYGETLLYYVRLSSMSDCYRIDAFGRLLLSISDLRMPPKRGGKRTRTVRIRADAREVVDEQGAAGGVQPEGVQHAAPQFDQAALMQMV
ncbi:hypothetical protein F2Q69_00012486 [Brassica cretica]|uniref:Uncharacterized protein n=1 Tax=Brassica cretica TaxID=69181 RepID=A0A8S9R1K6_BRACR|nr:hypothetical protein F2Q69_00012486 [Brassica cretica]